MNTQNTVVHVHLWKKSFWLISIAYFLLAVAVTMLIPTLPLWMLYEDGLSVREVGMAMGSFSVGLFLLGGFCSYLVQRFRRNQVCVWAMAALAGLIWAPLFFTDTPVWVMMLIRVGQGAAFGLSIIVLASTLVIDTCESFHRTEANHSATWFGRFALSLGPLAGLLVYQWGGYQYTAIASVGCLVVGMLLILAVHFPFRVPEDQLHLWCLDRFFLPKGWPLFLNLFLISLSLGLLMTLSHDYVFYALMMAGFLLALLAQRFVFPVAELKSEVLTGLALQAASILILVNHPHSPLVSPLLGLGIGLSGARFLLFFIKLSRHCQRGTAQSTFLLAWESGIALGLGLGYWAFEGETEGVCTAAIVLVALALIIYQFWVHNWFIQNKNR